MHSASIDQEKKTINKKTVIRNDRKDRNVRQRNDRKKMMY